MDISDILVPLLMLLVPLAIILAFIAGLLVTFSLRRGKLKHKFGRGPFLLGLAVPIVSAWLFIKILLIDGEFKGYSWIDILFRNFLLTGGFILISLFIVPMLTWALYGFLALVSDKKYLKLDIDK